MSDETAEIIYRVSTGCVLIAIGIGCGVVIAQPRIGIERRDTLIAACIDAGGGPAECLGASK